jgi:ABC-type uncharacterized transport system ATPase subunit
MPDMTPLPAIAAIAADKLTKKFGRLTAVDQLSFNVFPGEMAGLREHRTSITSILSGGWK